MKAFVVLLLALLAAPALAQTRQPAQITTLPTTSPQEFDLLDNTGKWTPFGAASGGAFSGMGREINLASFGAKCDGVADDTTAVQNWLAKATPQSKLVGSPGQCVFKGALVIPAVDDLNIDFQGGVLRYQGADTTIDLLSIGQQATDCVAHRVDIRNLTMISDTAMTAGDAFLGSEVCVLTMEHVYFGHVWLANNFYNGCHFSGGNQVYINDYSCRGTHAGEVDNGNDAAHGGAQSTDMYHYNGALSNSGLGLLIAGNCGGCFWDSVDVVNNANNVLIDQSQTPGLPNIQISFGPNFASDGTPGNGVEISDPGSALTCPGPGRCGNQFFCKNCWISTAKQDCLVIDAGVKWQITLTGIRMENCKRNGINNASNQIHLIVDGGVIAQSISAGIFNTASLPWVTFLNYPSTYGNGGGDFVGLEPTIASGCGGSGSAINVNSDYDYQISWGNTAGQTTCTVNFGGYHQRSASWTGVATAGVVTTGNVSASTTTGQTITLQTAPSHGNIIEVLNRGLGF